MAGGTRGIGTHGQRPTEKAGNRGASNYCFGWFHVLILFVCVWCLVAPALGLRWRRRSNSTISYSMRVGFYSRGRKGTTLFQKTAQRAPPARKRYLPTLIARQDRRPGFERNGNATVPLLHPPLAHFYDEHQSSHGLRATISHQT